LAAGIKDTGDLLSEVQTDEKQHREAIVQVSAPDPSPAILPKLSFQTEMGRVSRHSGIAFAGTIFSAGLGYFFKIYLARVLGADALGQYALGMTIISFLGVVNAFGLPDAAMRFVAHYSAAAKFAALRSLLWNGAGILLAGNLVFAVVLLKIGPWIVTRFYHSPQLVHYLPLFAAIMLTGALISFFSKVLAGYQQVGRRTVITRFIATPLTVAITIVLISLGAGLRGYLMAQIASAIVVVALLVAMTWRLTPSAARSPDLKRLSLAPEVWSFSAAMLGVGLMEFLMGEADRVALGYFRGAYEVGIYSVAAALVAYEIIILQSVNQVFGPIIADLHTRGEHLLLGRMFQTLTKWMLGLTCPLAFVMIVFAQPIMRIFGRDFAAGWPILVIGTCGQLVNCGVGSVGFLLLMSGNQRRLVRVQAIMAVIMVALSIWLVPLWGAWGAAVAAAITNIGVNIWNLIEVNSALRISPYNSSYFKLLPPVGLSLFIALLMTRVSVFAKVEWMNVLLTLALVYAAFTITALLIGLDADDRLIANAAWNRVRGAFAQ
jgi:O-antigen/teichoic acid export membrane protein